MKTVNVILMSIALLTLLTMNAGASNKQVGGLIIGGSTGAIVGNTIGKNTESTIIGATVGGVLGLVIGTELDKHHNTGINHSQVVTYSKKYHKRPRSSFRGNNRHNKYKKDVYRNSPRYHRNSERCRKIVTVQKDHNKTRRVITTSCRNNHRNHNSNKNHNRYNNRPNDRYYR